MGRLYRGLYRIRVDGELRGEQQTYEQAEVAALIAADDGATRVRIERVPDSRAPWEADAPFGASDPPFFLLREEMK